MTAHVVFTTLDPGLPATTSAVIIAQVIRGLIGFGGVLMSDDVSMGALSGTIAQRTGAALTAGCDLVLHCNGNLAEMEAVAGAASALAGKAAKRAQAALAARTPPLEIDLRAARREFAQMMTDAGTVTG
jgi:beta-N-acetylhexosaminidase